MRSAPAEQSFFTKTSVPHLLNNHFHQKQASGTRRTTIFIKNKRAAPAEQLFLRKTSERQPPNEHFHQKQASGNRRTAFFKNKHTKRHGGLKQWTEQAHDAAPQALKERTMGEIANGFDVYTGLLVVQINGFKAQGRGTVVEK